MHRWRVGLEAVALLVPQGHQPARRHARAQAVCGGAVRNVMNHIILNLCVLIYKVKLASDSQFTEIVRRYDWGGLVFQNQK